MTILPKRVTVKGLPVGSNSEKARGDRCRPYPQCAKGDLDSRCTVVRSTRTRTEPRVRGLSDLVSVLPTSTNGHGGAFMICSGVRGSHGSTHARVHGTESIARLLVISSPRCSIGW